MELKRLREENKLIDLFCDLVQIPSPSLKESDVADRVIKILSENKITAELDNYGNVLARVLATDLSKKPILLSAHMDVVGDDSSVNIALDSGFIETDKKRTLGADNKAGVAAAIMLAIDVFNNPDLKHGGIELVFTRDEEQSMTGVKNVDIKKLESEYILVLDADKLGQVLISGASYTKLTLKVDAFLGGHSGIDITDEERLNAIKLISELICQIPQGAYKKDELGVITSINVGAVVGGGIESSIPRICEAKIETSEYNNFILENSMTNIINKKAAAIYSIRSADKNQEQKLIEEIECIVSAFNQKYSGLASAGIEVEEHLPAFEKSDDTKVVELAKKAGEKQGININVSSFHAGAETHIYANNTNKYGEKFKPCLLGVADIYNMHSPDEKLEYKTYLKGYEFLKEFFYLYNCI